MVGIFQVGVILGENVLGGLSEWELSWVGIVRMGVFLGENVLWWGFSGWEFS